MAQREAMAYGSPSYGAIVFGGENSGTFTLYDWTFAEDLNSRSTSAQLAVHAADNDTMRARLDAARDALQASSGNAAITVGADRTFTGNITVAGQLVTFTRTAGSTFVEVDLGLPLHITGVGSYAVTRRVSASVVEMKLAPGLTAPSAATGVSASLGEVLVRCVDKDSAGVLEKAGGYRARTSVSRSPDPEDDQQRRALSFSAQFERPAGEVRVESGQEHRRSAQVARTISPEGLGRVTFSGTVTAGQDASGDGQEARALLTTAVNTWVASQLVALFSGATMELVDPRADSWDDEGALLTFQRGYQEMNFPNLDSAVDDPRITGAQVSFSRSYENTHGIRKGRQPFTVSVSYSAGITATGPDATSYEDIDVLWTKTIKPFLMARLKAIFGGTAVIMGGTDPVIDPVSSRISAQLAVLVSDSGSNVYSYSRTTSMKLDERMEIDDVWDGLPNTYVLWTPGQRITGVVTVNVMQLGDPERLQGSGGAGGGNSLADLSGLGSGGTFFSGGSISLGLGGMMGVFGGSADADAQTSPGRYEAFPIPGNPSKFFAPKGKSLIGGNGRWLCLGRSASETPQYWGEDPDGQGNRVKVTTTNFQADYLWVAIDEGGGTKTDPAEPDRIPTQNRFLGAGSPSKPGGA